MRYDRYIFHVDVNSAFLSWSAVERLKNNPDSVDLRTVPSAVGGDVEKRRGVITAKSVPAKKMGVKSGEPVITALKKCPQLVLISGDFVTYRKYSKQFITVLKQFSPLVEQVSIDEAFVDMTGMEKFYAGFEEKFPVVAAIKLKDEIYNRLGFTVNIGISTNKLLAKMASDFEKPDKVHTLYPYEVPYKLWHRPTGDLFGCGKASVAKLQKVGIKTIGDLAKADVKLLTALLGESAGRHLHCSANGIGDNHVHIRHGDAKSYSNETTIPFDITVENYVSVMPDILRELSEIVASRLRRDGKYAKTLGVSIKTDLFERRSMQMQMDAHTNSTELLFKNSMKLMEKLLLSKNGIFEKGRGVRLVGVGVTQIDDGEYRQMTLSDFEDLRLEKGYNNYKFTKDSEKETDAVIDKIREEFGKDAIMRAGQLNNKK